MRVQIHIQQGKAIPNLLVVVDEGRRTASETRDEEIGSDVVDVIVQVVDILRIELKIREIALRRIVLQVNSARNRNISRNPQDGDAKG